VSVRAALLSLGVAALASGAWAQPPDPYLAPEVRGVTLLTHDGGRVDWSKQNKIAFDRRSPSGYYDVWVMDADGGGQRCLTCAAPGAPTKNKGNPAWHPSGRYIVFQGQKETMPAALDHVAEPGRGVGNNLWLMTADGAHYWEIVNADRGHAPSGILHPHFSADGGKLVWTQLIGADGQLGDWELHVADFAIHDGAPVLSHERTFRPGTERKFYESHGFFPDGRSLLYTAQTPVGLDDEFALDLATGVARDLTHASTSWNEHAQIDPAGRRIVWATSRDIPGPLRWLNLWMMDADGGHQHRLVDFHRENTPIFAAGIGPGDSSWSPDGRRLAVYVIGDRAETKGDVYVVDFNN
jgi:Tol biopolymer transport system component